MPSAQSIPDAPSTMPGDRPHSKISSSAFLEAPPAASRNGGRPKAAPCQPPRKDGFACKNFLPYFPKAQAASLLRHIPGHPVSDNGFFLSLPLSYPYLQTEKAAPKEPPRYRLIRELQYLPRINHIRGKAIQLFDFCISASIAKLALRNRPQAVPLLHFIRPS